MAKRYYETENGTRFEVEASNRTQEKVKNLIILGEYKTNKQLKYPEKARKNQQKG